MISSLLVFSLAPTSIYVNYIFTHKGIYFSCICVYIHVWVCMCDTRAKCYQGTKNCTAYVVYKTSLHSFGNVFNYLANTQ